MRDAIGNELSIGDTVAYAKQGHRYQQIGKITRFTAKSAEIDGRKCKISEYIIKIRSENQVIISREEYLEMKKATNHLYHLQALGVDNWEGYERPDFDEDGDIIEEDEDEF